MIEREVSKEEVERLYTRLTKEAEAGGYHLNPDVVYAKSLLRGLLENEQRYGYQSCPCRLASGRRQEDVDIVCPCDYRDPDLSEHGQCYCALYVSGQILEGKQHTQSIPERRFTKEKEVSGKAESSEAFGLGFPVWRCRVCGYLCARGSTPEVCPICKAKKERFERFI
jgi:ferredoxin-thioredoxin reductase catalytic subunit